GAKFPQADYRAWLFARLPGGNNAQTMSAALAKGMMVGAAGTPKVSRSTGASTARAVAALPPVARPTTALSAPSSGEFFLVTYPSPTLGDGRGANKPWLQELPDPVTKVLWSSWVEIHPETAARLGIDRGDILEVKTASGTVRAPAFPYMGIHKDAIAIPLGQGHRSTAKMDVFN